MDSAVTQRHAKLRAAQDKAKLLLLAVEQRGLIRPGVLESKLSQQVCDLAGELFGVRQFWHKRIVRAGPNTLAPYAQNPPDRPIEERDILFLDLGPVFARWEADVGQTYVLGDDPTMHRLVRDVEECWQLAKAYFESHQDITGAELYAFVSNLATQRGWEYGQEHCGHLIGEFPHESLQGEDRRNYIHPANGDSMRLPDRNGDPRDWILEMHFIDRRRQIGSFFEQALTVP